MTATNQDFEMTQGDSKQLVIPVVDETGAPLSLVGATVRWLLSRGPGTTPLIIKQSPLGIDISATSFTVTLTPADTQQLHGKFYHEAELTEADTAISTVTVGTATIKVGQPPPSPPSLLRRVAARLNS